MTARPSSATSYTHHVEGLCTFTAPAPRALIWLSPEPGATITSGESPSSSAISGLSLPTTCNVMIVVFGAVLIGLPRG